MYSNMIQNDGDIIVTQKGISDTFFSDVDRKLLEKINKLENVSTSYAMVVGASPVGKLPIAGIYGTTKNHFKHYKLSAGAYPQEGEVILGNNIQTQIDNKTIKIANKTFKVSGIFKSGIGFEEGGVVMHIKDAGALFNRSASFLVVKVHNYDTIDDTIVAIKQLSDKIEVKTTQNFVKEYNQFKIIENSSYVISFMAFAMGLLGISSVMSMIVNSRKQEFGIMRAVGKSKLFIMKNLFVETILLSMSAYIFAYLLSFAILSLLPYVETLQGYVSGNISLSMAFGVFVATLLMALFGSLLPALIASKTDPVLLINQGCS